MEQPHHRVTIVIDTDDNKKLQEVIRFILGLQRIVAPDVEIDYATELSDELLLKDLKDSKEDALDHSDEPF